MVADESFNQHLDRVVKHYSSLFILPSYKKITLFSVVICVFCGLAASTVLFPFPAAFLSGLLCGVSFFLINTILNYFFAFRVLKGDPVYDLRRTAALSLFCWVLWLFFIFIGDIAALFFGIIWAVKLCLLGFSAVLILRFIVLNVTSSSNFKRRFATAVVQPFLCLAPLIALWIDIVNVEVISAFLAYALIIAFASNFVFIWLLDNMGKRIVGIPSLAIFRAFLLNWVANLNAPLESYLEKIGEKREIEASIMKFDCPSTHVFVVVSTVHPGPFKNIGSSILPSMLKDSLEKKFNGVACVPLGLLGHELDLASQAQNQKIIDYVVGSAVFKAEETKATPFIKVSDGVATACCQIFGETALTAFSLAPNTTEDFPQELGLIIRKEAEKLGLKACLIINAHNSIDGTVNSQKALESLEKVAVACLKKAVSARKKPFKIGAASVKPKEFSLADGMGVGGITVIAVEVDKQKIAYVVIDGNNMVSGLREKILAALQSTGFDDGEVFTTDTHSVNALTLNKRGYHPVGETIDHEQLIEYVTKTAQSALANSEHAKAGCRSIMVPEVRVIGQKPLEKLCTLPDVTLRRAKSVLVPLFGATALLLMLGLLFV